ncbi:CPBP family intramembrane glutamic endopeptidase [Agromyces subbeticus]|uniref:CPBP family intramembrane glutamic endopeptidase n=1 Tax=Agromyces subbeticus TaxID=293890 RepID=UPI0003B73DA8|nr:type II CAAX endopeptidase family protein [Agromyces subbeticus]
MTSPLSNPARTRSQSIGRITLLVATFLFVMVAVNTVASALPNPLVSLVVGPAMGVLVLWLYAWSVRRLEARPVVELARPRFSRLAVGALGGLALATVTIGIIALLGGYQITGAGTAAGALTVVGMMCAVAVTEEVLFRGVILQLLERAFGTWIALAGSGVLFGLVHLLNPGATLWGAVAIAVEAGLMLGAAFVATRSLWLPIGLHLGWNVAIVALFGTVSSGSDAQGSLVDAVTQGPAWLTGGTFGPEASLVAVLACSAVTTALMVWAHRNGRIVPRPRRQLVLR